MKLTVASLFAGCGGSSEGYRQAGYRCVAAVEWEPLAAAAYHLNFPGVPVLEMDIRTLAGTNLLIAAGLAAGELDVLDGSPPCQSFSTAGKRRINDPRGDLFEEYARILRELRPRAFVAENVSGMVKGRMLGTFKRTLTDLSACGYRVRCRLVETQYLGVPQARQRLIFIGIRDDLGIEPSHPAPATKPISAGSALGISPDAFQLAGGYGHITGGGEPAATITRIHPPKVVLTRSMSINRWRPVPAATVTATDSDYRALDNGVERRLTIQEALRLQGFPATFVLPDASYSRQWALIGNAVPPPLTRAIGIHLAGLLSNGG